jgi:hypothetical protein
MKKPPFAAVAFLLCRIQKGKMGLAESTARPKKSDGKLLTRSWVIFQFAPKRAFHPTFARTVLMPDRVPVIRARPEIGPS